MTDLPTGFAAREARALAAQRRGRRAARVVGAESREHRGARALAASTAPSGRLRRSNR
jgi:hypothetical protein